MTHVGNDRGPELSSIVGMSKGDYPEAVVQVVTPEFVEAAGKIEIYKKDPKGAALSGAYFIATNTSTGTEYDDIFQIGCIGLCKAAATDKGGTFSTYAYRLIWNEICDALIYSTRRQAAEFSSDMIPLVAEEPTVSIADVATQLDVQAALKAAKQEASPCVVKGIEAMIQMTKGRSSKEIGNEFGVSANLVCAWVSKARKYLKSRPEILALAET